MLNVTYHDIASRTDFLLDSGASSHMSCESSWMQNFHRIPSREIRLADNSMKQAHAAGDLILEAHQRSKSVQKVTVKDVLLVPKLGLNPLLCSRLAEKDVSSVFDKHGCALIDTQNIATNFLVPNFTITCTGFQIWLQHRSLKML
jgi:hypothetical protein